MRTNPIPPEISVQLALFRDDAALKAYPDYRAAKAGNGAAAVRLVQSLAPPLYAETVRRFSVGAIYVAPHAIEATGENAIPTVLATALAAVAKGQVDGDIVQENQVFHTGADPMERLNARSGFDGAVRQGAGCVLVDDVTTMGGTLADLTHHIVQGGGWIVGAVVSVNAAQSGRLAPDRRLVTQLERRFGDVIRNLFRIAPAALTAEEAGYRIGFRSADEIRNRSIKARQETADRVRARGVRRDEAP